MNRIIILIFCFIICSSTQAQQDSLHIKEHLSLDDVILLAKQLSPDALLAKHTFRSSYWEYKSYKASKLPNVSLSSTLPYLNRSTDMVTQSDGSESFVHKNTMYSSMTASVSQNIGLTGGTLSLTSDLDRIDQFGDDYSKQFSSTPVSINYSQSLNGYNSFKWENKISPLEYEKAKRTYLSSMESIAIKAIQLFFDVASSQLNYDIALVNYENADTLYKLGKGRFSVGTIAEDELLQLELSLINAQITVKESDLSLSKAKIAFLNYLGIDKNYDFSLQIPDTIPYVQLEYEKVRELTYANNPEILDQKIQSLEAEQSYASAKASNGFQADMSMSLNLSQNANSVNQVYQDPETGQIIRLSFSVPLIDWGERKGAYKMAQSKLELAKSILEQTKQEFEQEIINNVIEFNFQHEKYIAACKADTIAQLRYFISKKRYLINKITILELNTALTQKDGSRKSYIASIQDFWIKYYEMRELTLYDFINDEALHTKYDAIVE